MFAWKVAKYVKSNAIVFCAAGMTVGIGAGQMSRIDSARIAGMKAAQRRADCCGARQSRAMRSSRFRDGLDVVIDAGATMRDSSGRLDARRRGDRGRERARHRDGVDRRAPLPTLSATG